LSASSRRSCSVSQCLDCSLVAHSFWHLLTSTADTEGVKSATATLNKAYYTSPASLNALLQVVCKHPKPELRQLGAVEARKLVGKHWVKLPADQKSSLRSQLCEYTLAEEATLVRHSAARVIAAIATQDFEDGEWGELPGFLQQAATSSQVRHREVGTFIIGTTLESVGDAFPGKKADLYKLFSSTIQDPESADVRVNTMLALRYVYCFRHLDGGAKVNG
jgi:importin-4